jgi:hypothetical protein
LSWKIFLLFLLGVLDVIRVGFAAGEKLFDVFGASKPDWNTVVDVLNAVQEERAVRKKSTFGVTSRISSWPVVAIPPAFSKMKAIGAASYKYRSLKKRLSGESRYRFIRYSGTKSAKPGFSHRRRIINAPGKYFEHEDEFKRYLLENAESSSNQSQQRADQGFANRGALSNLRLVFGNASYFWKWYHRAQKENRLFGKKGEITRGPVFRKGNFWRIFVSRKHELPFKELKTSFKSDILREIEK